MDPDDKTTLRVSFFQLDAVSDFLLGYGDGRPVERLQAALLQELKREVKIESVPSTYLMRWGQGFHAFPDILRNWFANKSEPFTNAVNGLRVHVLLVDKWTPWRLREPFMAQEPSTRVLNAACREMINAALGRRQTLESWFWKPFIEEQIKVLQERTITDFENPNLVRVETLMANTEFASLAAAVDQCVKDGMQTVQQKDQRLWDPEMEGVADWTKAELKTLIDDLKSLTAGTLESAVGVAGQLAKLWFRDHRRNPWAEDFALELIETYRNHTQGFLGEKRTAFADRLFLNSNLEIFAWAAQYEYGAGDRIISTREPDFLRRVSNFIPPQPSVELETGGRIKILSRDGRVVRVV